MDLKEIWYKINHFHFKVSHSTTILLGVVMTVLLMAYCVTGIIQFIVMDAMHPELFITAYCLWLVIGAIFLVFYAERPLVFLGLYMIVIAADRLITLYIIASDIGIDSIDYVEVAFAVIMMVNGIRWCLGRVRTKIFALISATFFLLTDIDFVFEAIDYLEFDETLLFITTTVLLQSFYAMMIIMLLCNDITGEDTKIADLNLK